MNLSIKKKHMIINNHIIKILSGKIKQKNNGIIYDCPKCPVTYKLTDSV